MLKNKTMDCTTKQWRDEIKRQHDAGEAVIMIRSNAGGFFRLGELPNDDVAAGLNIISV
jgi:hypothetical protein